MLLLWDENIIITVTLNGEENYCEMGKTHLCLPPSPPIL